MHSTVESVGFLVRDEIAFVFNDASAFGNTFQSEHTAAVDWRVAHGDSAAFFSWFWHNYIS
jgi:hypothetical protein